MLCPVKFVKGSSNDFFPKVTYLTFDSANSSAILGAYR